jgi:hypothetical protein
MLAYAPSDPASANFAAPGGTIRVAGLSFTVRQGGIFADVDPNDTFALHQQARRFGRHHRLRRRSA